MFNSKFRNYENKLFLIASVKEDKLLEDIDTFTEGRESYLEDESEEEDWEGSSSSFQDYYKDTVGGITSFV